VTIERIAPARYQRTRWKNDMGWTTELALLPRPGAEGDFDWRISIAEIDSDCAFSAFPGVDRSLMLIDGDGIELSGEGFATQTLRARGQVARFPGEQAPHCRVIGAPSRDFNTMTRRGAFRHELWLRPLVGTMMLFAEARTYWFLYTLNGRVQVAQGRGTGAPQHGRQRADPIRTGRTEPLHAVGWGRAGAGEVGRAVASGRRRLGRGASREPGLVGGRDDACRQVPDQRIREHPGLVSGRYGTVRLKAAVPAPAVSIATPAMALRRSNGDWISATLWHRSTRVTVHCRYSQPAR
jgi:environmental stress-induced protein Ves